MHRIRFTFALTMAAGLLPSLLQAQVSFQRTYGGTKAEEGYSVQPTSDGGYIICGSTESYGAGNADVWLIKTDARGYAQWTRTYGGSDWDEGYSVQQTADGGYIIAGYTSSFKGGPSDVYLIRTDANGNTAWTKAYGGDRNDQACSVRQTTGEKRDTSPISNPKRVNSDQGQAPDSGKLRDISADSARPLD